MASNKEVLAKIIIPDGQHLVRSKNNPDLFRGISFDANNQNPHIPEIKLVSTGDTAKTFLIKLAIGVGFSIVGGVAKSLTDKAIDWVFDNHINNDKGEKAQQNLQSNDSNSVEIETLDPEIIITNELAVQYQSFFDLSPEEFEDCVLDIIYHMIAIANDMRFLANKRIFQEAKNEEQFKQLKSEYKRSLVNGLAANLDHLLSADNLVFDEATNQKLNDLLGGGFTKDGQYFPVKFKKVNDAMYMLAEKKSGKNHKQNDETLSPEEPL